MNMGFIAVISFVVLLFFVSGYINEKRGIKQFENRLKSEYGKKNSRKYSVDELKAVKGLYRNTEAQYFVDDITWNDLDLWSVYKQMNYCNSSAGDEYLFKMLKVPKVKSTNWNYYESRIEWFKENEDERVAVQKCLHGMGRSGKYSIYDYLDKLTLASDYSNVFDIVLDVLYIISFVLCFFNALIGVIAFVIIVVINVMTYFEKKHKIEPYLVCFNYVSKVLYNASRLQKLDIEILKEEKISISNSLKVFKSFLKNNFLVSGNAGNGPAGIILDYLKMLTHVDLIKFKSMAWNLNSNKNEIVEILETIGKLDVCISIGEYRSFLNNYCLPQFNDSNKISVSQLYHPLLNNPVCNDLTVEKSVLLTGSNASGKSTFLKTVALNILLAQSIHTVCANNYEAPYMALYTSLNLKDSISSGDSYYMAEIKAIKRILDATKILNTKVVGFVDEVLRGTNTTERIAASSTILKNLSSNSVIVFAATHDLELTSILTDNFINYHFEEDLKDNDVCFPYKIKEGKATSRNAIKLLGLLGFDKNITDDAKAMVDNYEKKGAWT